MQICKWKSEAGQHFFAQAHLFTVQGLVPSVRGVAADFRLLEFRGDLTELGAADEEVFEFGLDGCRGPDHVIPIPGLSSCE